MALTQVQILRNSLASRGMDPVPDNDILNMELDKAENYINSIRGYVADEGESTLEEKYKYLQITMCVYSILKWGAEGQTSHSENGISRGYEEAVEYPESLMRQVVPLYK